jgi:phosphonate transport system ATP-binding protein
MAALRAINREDGITLICNLHAPDTARTFCDRVIGMARGKFVFDGPPAALTPAALRRIYGVDEPVGDVDVATETSGLGILAHQAEELLPTAR